MHIRVVCVVVLLCLGSLAFAAPAASRTETQRALLVGKRAPDLELKTIEGNGQVVFRYAEVLLSLAEAINEQRGPAEAYQYVNMVRARAGVSDFAGMTQDQLRQAILDERGRELYAEGVRRQDLVRNGSLISNALTRGKTNAKSHMILFPIPNAVIVQGRGVIKQNPGYN